tara:strand:- start:444 stop:1115 length:672 start_codon:yes stop_codon:yes gene_type:complete
MIISVITGIAAGALHVVGGADHLVAMAPSGIRHPRAALRNGLAWGIGHSAGVLILSSFAILIKDFSNIERMSTLAEFFVGVTLLVVGILAIKTSVRFNIHTHSHQHEHGYKHDHVHVHFLGRKKHLSHQHALTSLGVLHGLAGASHLLAVIPALALPPLEAVLYMVAYLLSAIFTMGIFLCAISLAYGRIGKKSLPLMIRLTGVLSVLTGFIWIQKTSLFSIF